MNFKCWKKHSVISSTVCKHKDQKRLEIKPMKS